MDLPWPIRHRRFLEGNFMIDGLDAVLLGDMRVFYWRAALQPVEAQLQQGVSEAVRRASANIGHALRRREWLATRYLSQRLAGHEPISGNYGEPHWEKGLVGSISHKQGHVAMWIGLAEDGFGGVDLELCRTLADGVVAKMTDHSERAMLVSLQDCAPLVFSAKESIYKALFPLVRKKFWFDAVRLEDVCLAGSSSILDFVVTADLSITVRAGMRLRVFGKRILIEQSLYWLTALKVRQFHHDSVGSP
jgi:4'-phosphopantetheinyl transferase EntD